MAMILALGELQAELGSDRRVNGAVGMDAAALPEHGQWLAVYDAWRTEETRRPEASAMAIAGDGFLHMSWGMHAHPLLCAKSDSSVLGVGPIVMTSLGTGAMTGQESGVTAVFSKPLAQNPARKHWTRMNVTHENLCFWETPAVTLPGDGTRHEFGTRPPDGPRGFWRLDQVEEASGGLCAGVASQKAAAPGVKAESPWIAPGYPPVRSPIGK